MGQKLHRSRRTMFKKKNPVLAVLLWIVGCLAVVAVGFFGAKYVAEHPLSVEGTESVPTEVSSAEKEEIPVVSVVSAEDVRGFTLPGNELNDFVSSDRLAKAVAGGFNTVVVEMKDSAGTLYYNSATEQAVQVGAFSPNALSLVQLGECFTALSQAGLRPVVRLTAFQDNAAARVLADARICPAGSSTWVWYDNDPAAGGKAWLNPYADAAHLYIIGLAKELRDAGAQGVMLDGVCFPARTVGADFGTSSNTSLTQGEVLSAFVEKAKAMLGDACPVMLCCTDKSAMGENTTSYGGNPLMFGASAVAPSLTVNLPAPEEEKTPAQMLKDACLTAVRQLVARVQVMDSGEKPVLCPVLSATDYTGEELTGAVQGCLEGGATSYILTDATGMYPFEELHP